MHLVGCFIRKTGVKFSNKRNPKDIHTFPRNIPPRTKIYSHNGHNVHPASVSVTVLESRPKILTSDMPKFCNKFYYESRGNVTF